MYYVCEASSELLWLLGFLEQLDSALQISYYQGRLRARVCLKKDKMSPEPYIHKNSMNHAYHI